MTSTLDDFAAFRQEMNDLILSADNLDIKRFFQLDSAVYREGALDAVSKELMGLVASLVLRCNDCVTYHLQRCADLGVTDAQFFEAFSIGLVVGGSIVIPHLRQAVAMLGEIRKQSSQNSGREVD